MLASTGVIGVVLDDRKIVARMSEIEVLNFHLQMKVTAVCGNYLWRER